MTGVCLSRHVKQTKIDSRHFEIKKVEGLDGAGLARIRTETRDDAAMYSN